MNNSAASSEASRRIWTVCAVSGGESDPSCQRRDRKSQSLQKGYDLPNIIRDFKRYMATQTVAILSDKWFHEKMCYMHNNPVRKGFVANPEDWKYSSTRYWILDDHDVISLDLDQL